MMGLLMKGGHVIPEKRSTFHSIPERVWSSTRQWFVNNTFAPHWLKGRWRSPVASYSVAVLLELCVLCVTFLLVRLFPSFMFPGALTFITVTFIALSWGAGPGLIATVMGALLINYAVVAPNFVWDIDGWDDAVEQLLFIGVGIGIAVIASQTEKARRNAEQARSHAEEFAASLQEAERRTQVSLEALLVMAETLVQVRGDGDSRDSVGDNGDTNSVTQQLVELIRSVLACKRVSITAFGSDMYTPRSVAVVGLSPELEAQWRARAAGFNLHELFVHSGVDPQFRSNEVVILDMTRPPFSNDPNPFGIHVMLLAPMRVSNQLVGVLSLDYGEVEHEYTQEEIALARVVAKLAALVLERERLLRERAEARANELALREASRRMDEFLSIASHELRTPLTAIKGNVQLAQRRLDKLLQEKEVGIDGIVAKLDAVRELLERAERQMRMQNRLVNDLLDVSRIQADKLEMQPALCDLATIVREAVREQQLVAAPRIIQLRVETQEPVPVLADADRISQVVTNYLTNALKYSEAAKPVEVCVRANGGEVRVLVRDHGPGLSLSEQEHIWDRFYRVEGIAVQSGSGVGLGLGLHICRTIIEAQGGQVGVESEPGGGSTFWFTLPLAEKLPSFL